MSEIRYVLGGRPCPWQRARASGPARYTPQRMRAAQSAHRLAASVAITRLPGRSWPLAGAFAVDVEVYEHPSQRGDVDNLGKLVLDALQGVAYVTDRSVVEVHFRRRVDRERPRTEVVVRRLEAAEKTQTPREGGHRRSQGVKPPCAQPRGRT